MPTCYIKPELEQPNFRVLFRGKYLMKYRPNPLKEADAKLFKPMISRIQLIRRKKYREALLHEIKRSVKKSRHFNFMEGTQKYR